MFAHISCFFVILLACKISHSKVVELSSSVVMMGAADYIIHGNTSECTNMVDRAALETNSRLNFVPTLFWVDRLHNLDTSTTSNSISYFCLHRSYKTDGTVSCEPATQEDVDNFERSMQACFMRAVEYNMSIEVSPRLRHSTEQTIPSNTLDFDPLLDYEDFSYMEVMLTPLAHALNGAINNKTEAWIALQGQMGTSLFKYPMEYLQALGTTYYALHAGLPEDWPDLLHIGVSLNFYNLCGCILLNIADPAEYSKLFLDAFRAVKHTFDFEILHELFNRLDFISVAGLAPLSPGFPLKDLQITLQLFAEELMGFGISLHDMLVKQGFTLHWVDFGIGGFTSDGQPALTAAEAAVSSSSGVSGLYSQVSDPWRSDGSETPVRHLLSYFYNNTAEYFWKQHEYKFEVDAAYLYNFGSWDIQAIHPASTSVEGSYQFESVNSVIRYHNRRSQRLINLSKSLGEAGVRFLIESRELQHKEPIQFAKEKHVENLQKDRHV